ncbi:MAG: hypothetical protein M1818_003886 [Claussenomyces sp. TS43310]|nr:MAG: hypothetical protein M1818_003886 [Claussenomyces sp. TS43310]
MEVKVPVCADAHADLAEDMTAMTAQNLPIEAANSMEAAQLPHRSHDPATNQKRIDPFQFGSRYLGKEDDVFEFNAWDHVEPDDAYKEYAEMQFAKQREAPVSEFDKSRFNSDPAKWWNLFYKNNTASFFKDRKWLQQECGTLRRVLQADAGPVTILEVGAGAGNTAFPILANNHNPSLKIHACDFSKTAVEVMRESDAYDTKCMQADVWDVAGVELPPDVRENTVDLVMMIFVFSALSPDQWGQAVRNIHRILKPGGEVFFRDYGRNDLAQVRFKKGRYMEPNFYVRGDGTRVYYFEKDELAQIWSGPFADEKSESDESSDVPTATGEEGGFDITNLAMDHRLLVNRGQKIKMYRAWLQGRFVKRLTGGSGGGSG